MRDGTGTRLAAIAAGLALLGAAGGWWAVRSRTSPAVPVVTSAHRTVSPSPSPSPTPSAGPSPSPSATPSPTPRPTVPPPRPAAVPAHPPAPPPPKPPPPPPGSTTVTLAVPWYHQVYNLSCEEASLRMVLAYFGVGTTDQALLQAVGVDGIHYWNGPGGGDPYQAFVGDPNGSEVVDPSTGKNTGYGVYWPPIRRVAEGFGAPVERAGEGISPAAVYAAIRAGQPVLVWVTYNWQADARRDYTAWDGAAVPYAGPWEHAMVVTGIDGDGVRVNDPDRGQYWVPFAVFEAAYAVYDQMAVIFAGRGSRPPTTPTTPPPPPATSTPSPTPATPTPSPASSLTPGPSPS
jgi:uncharacterized protein YvpB